MLLCSVGENHRYSIAWSQMFYLHYVILIWITAPYKSMKITQLFTKVSSESQARFRWGMKGWIGSEISEKTCKRGAEIVMHYSAGLMNHAQECLKYSIHTYSSSGRKERWNKILQVRGVRLCCTNEKCSDARLKHGMKIYTEPGRIRARKLKLLADHGFGNT